MPYVSPSWMETPGRLSTTASTLVMADCCAIIGSATTFVAKIRGSSATTEIDSISRSIAIVTSSDTVSPGGTAAGASPDSNPARTSVTT